MPTVQYMSKEAAQAHKSPAYFLRLRMPAQSYAELPIEHPEVLLITVYPDSRIPDDICEQIISFAERAEKADGDIVVQCNEGKYRSRAVANFIWRFFEEYDHTGQDWKGGEMRNLNYISLHDYYIKTRRKS